MSAFIDRVVLHVRGGKGGHGCASVHREKYRPLGGPDGGNGGDGGDVILEVEPNEHTLLDFHYHPHAHAGNGRSGEGSNRDGKQGADLVLGVPEGTVVLDRDGAELADLVGAGTRFVAARGGRGGLGNAALVSRARRAPGFALLGEDGEERELVLELKSMADVGLVGFPSAGKSSLVSVLSAAKPKIADYPFTTLTPNLGVVSAEDTTFTIADVPGLIPGASAGRGLGVEFLRHLERCAVLAHVVDCATAEPGRDPLSDVAALEAELAAYRPVLRADIGLGDLADRPRAVILNKVDIPDAAELAEMVTADLQARGWPVFRVSTVTREGLRPLIFALQKLVDDYRHSRPKPVVRRHVIRPVARDDGGFTVVPDPQLPGGFIVQGQRPQRWVRQTQFDNDEAVGYLADRLARLGVEAELARLGAEPGCPVTIGDVTFDWEPQVSAGVDIVMSGRGSDPRLEATDRTSAAQRKYSSRVRRGLLRNNGDMPTPTSKPGHSGEDAGGAADKPPQ